MSVEMFLKKVAGITKLDDGLKKLDRMTNEEARMANAELLRVAHNIDETVQGVGIQVKDVGDCVQGISVQVRGVDENVNVLKEKVQMVIGGAETVLEKSLTSSLIFLIDQMAGKPQRKRKWRYNK